ncbi:uncharacterized protein F5147DRAFT_761279 [Suillus discolor]|uniref:Uncharacterized protein n=1 Tax=Suillus discolor TaxID=1912936 RepID=A0A9P7JTK5_9AGAM|nr:uncharacterized protein F5147DRAFT_761279 [Suillus discolor]KAG2107427.1 hypothetical protein F5147DRAFT_761279 [Suillus discolor]
MYWKYRAFEEPPPDGYMRKGAQYSRTSSSFLTEIFFGVHLTLRQTYLSFSELQYIVETSGQQLLVIPNTDDSIPISKRLQLLRDKAHAWFKVDTHPLKMVRVNRPPQSRDDIVAGGHFYWWNKQDDTAMILPVLPKPSQQTIWRNWPPGTLCSVPHSRSLDMFMDPAQNLIAVAYVVDYKRTYINLGSLDGDGASPSGCWRETVYVGRVRKLPSNYAWQLQIWDWKYSTTSSSILSSPVPDGSGAPELYFLGNNRLLVITNNLNLYSIENMSQTPELLACFLMPNLWMLRCHPMIDDIGYGSQLHMQAQATMCTSDPTHRLICLTTHSARDSQVFVISMRIFFDLNEMAAAMPIPWEHWAPSNTRIFWHPFHFKIHINGN